MNKSQLIIIDYQSVYTLIIEKFDRQASAMVEDHSEKVPCTGPSVRIWVMWKGCPVRLQLFDGQQLSAYSGGPTEEGWHSEWEQWTYNA